MGSSALSLTLLLMSFIHSGLTQDSPDSTLTVTPDSSVFTGERVRLTCEIESDQSDWRYEWNKDSVKLQSSERYTVNTDTLTIDRSESSDEGHYWCRGQRDGGSVSSQSSSVYLSVTDSPRSTLTVTPDNTVFTGERVRLKCVIESNSVWRRRNDLTDQRYYQTPVWSYEWYKDSVKLQSSERYTVNTDTLTIRAVTTSDEGQYTCRGQRDTRPNSSQSNSVSLSVKDSPRSTLTVTPDNTVFTGERVILTCVITPYYNNWRYEWRKGNSNIQVSQRHTVERNTLTIEGSESSDTGQYTCGGHIEGRSVSSQSNSAVSLSVKAFPRSTLTVTPDNTVFTGERVILKCVIESDHRDWRYEWYKGSVKLQSSQRLTVDRNTLTIEGSESSDEGQYTCRGHIEGRSVSSQSSSVSLSVKALPRSTLTVTPDNTVFTGERVRLTCEIESYSVWRQRNYLTYDRRYDQTPDWRYEWYKGSVKLQSSDRYTVNTDTLTIRAVTTSDEGQYTCRGQRDKRPNSSQSSSAVSLSVTVLPKTKLTVDPKSPDFTGETVNLKCVIESNHTDWRYEWYKDSVKLQSSDRYTVNTDTLTIKGATESDRGQFWCRGQRDKRPNSSQESEPIDLAVNAQISFFIIPGFLLAACPYLLVTVVLLYKCSRARVKSPEAQRQSL